jgi:hypothetical protein
MTVKYGTSRMVILLPRLGIALKFAQFHPFRVLRLLWNSIFHKKEKYGKLNWCQRTKKNFKRAFYNKSGEENLPFFWMHLFQGLFDNISEFTFHLLNIKNKFPVPTYFSLFGIVNIQALQKNVCKKDEDVWHHLCKSSSHKELWNSSKHTFSVAGNFSTDRDGKLKVIDYASKEVQRMIRKYGDKFHSVLIPK